MSNPVASEPIDLPRYAEVTAHLRHFPADKHAEVIARLGIRRRDWDAAAAKWQRVRDTERTSGKLEVTVRFGRVLADTRARLAALQPTLESLGPLPGPDGPPAQATAPVHSTPTPAHRNDLGGDNATGAPVVQAPSYLASAQHGEAPSRRAAERAAVAPPALVPAPALGSPLAGTANMDLSAIVAAVQRGALPFASSEASTPKTASTPRPGSEAPPRSSSGRTSRGPRTWTCATS